MRNVRNVLISGCSSYGRGNNYYEDGIKVLLDSVERYAKYVVDEIIIVDFDLNNSHALDLILNHSNVKVIGIPSYIKNHFKDLNVGHYMYYCLRHYIMSVISQYTTGSNFLWLDAGVCFVGNPREIFDTIEITGVFTVGHEDQTNRKWTSKETVDILKATDVELDSLMLFGGIFGYNKYFVYETAFANLYYLLFKIDLLTQSINDKQKLDSSGRIQTIMSILLERVGVYKHPQQRYAGHLSIEDDQVLFVHRCNSLNLEMLSEYNANFNS